MLNTFLSFATSSAEKEDLVFLIVFLKSSIFFFSAGETTLVSPELDELVVEDFAVIDFSLSCTFSKFLLILSLTAFVSPSLLFVLIALLTVFVNLSITTIVAAAEPCVPSALSPNIFLRRASPLKKNNIPNTVSTAVSI